MPFPSSRRISKHEDKTDHIRDISDTAHVCVDGTYDLQRAWRSDAAAYHEVFHGSENAVIYAFTQFLLLLPILFVNQKYFRNGFTTLARRSPNMDSLIAMGATAATVYGIFAIYRIGWGFRIGDMELVHQYSHDLYFESAGTILTLITVGKYLETKSKGKTSEAITKLMNLAPKTVTVVRDGKEQVIDAADVVQGIFS